MSRLVLPQFKQVDSSGNEIDRSLDLEDLDEAFASVAKAVNSDLGPGNLRPGIKLSAGVTDGAIPLAWREAASIVTFFAQMPDPVIYNSNSFTDIDLENGIPRGKFEFILGNVPSVGTWIPQRLSIIACRLDGASPPLVTVTAGTSYPLCTGKAMKRVEDSVRNKTYLLENDAPNTDPDRSFSRLKPGYLFKLDLRSPDGPAFDKADDYLTFGPFSEAGIANPMPNNVPIRVTFTSQVTLASASLSCLTPHVS